MSAVHLSLGPDRRLDLSGGPVLMGVVNASPDSFSDGGRHRGIDEQRRLAVELVEAGAQILDVGGQSAITGVPEIDPEVEIERIAPLVEWIVANLDAVVSVDTYKPPVAAAAMAAGARMINDVSGLREPEVAALCAREGAAIVVMHNLARPKQRLTDDDLYGDVAEDVAGFLADRAARARSLGVPADAIVLDPGPDFAKTPAQTVEALRGIGRLRALGHPLLLALSRKDFIGAITGRRPADRLAGTLAAVGAVGDDPGTILRVHDVAAVRDYLAIRRALDGRDPVDPGLRLDPGLRREPAGT